MRRLLFSEIKYAELSALVHLENRGIQGAPWDALAQGELSDADREVIGYVRRGLERFQPSVVNEATVWARAIFPLLTVAEAEGVEAQADVPLSARLGDVELVGTADGALGAPADGEIVAPFLIVVEAKRGVEGHNPITQLHAEMLAAALTNAREDGRDAQRIHGAYTIGANWTFVRADVQGIGGERPSMTVVSSPEMSGKFEAERIAQILKSVVAERRAARRGEHA